MIRAIICVASMLLSAFLLFALQPMLARLLLPSFGGSPAVWTTCMVFFQAVLLAGYAYAHSTLRQLGFVRQRWLHTGVLLLSLFLLPRALQLTAVPSAPPVALVLVALTMIAGAPFFVLSTNSSLTQHWFAFAGGGDGKRSGDPFWLYVASNVGSLAALLVYPLVIEPELGLRAQFRWWSLGYLAFVALSLLVMYTTHGPFENTKVARAESDERVSWPRRIKWVALAAVASSLLLSVTMQISTDIGSAPLFWVLPLAIYLVTFILAFADRGRPSRTVLGILATLGIALSFAIVIIPDVLPTWFAPVSLGILLMTLFAGALLCHVSLADDRPSVANLTTFYLALSLGGALGAVLNGIVAPLIFNSVAEFPVTLAALALVIRPFKRPKWTEWVFAIIAIAIIGVSAEFVMAERAYHVSAAGILRWQLAPLLVLALGLVSYTRPTSFPVAAILSGAFVAAGLQSSDPIVDEGRSFFGVSRVTENWAARVLVHGATIHGAQFKDSIRKDVPLSYYAPRGPLGWAVSHVPAGGEIGIVGLGAGSLASLPRGGQRITYFEIDPLIAQMARRDFTYLETASRPVDVLIGDGRQLLDRAVDARFDLLVIDAFTSDAIPTHLLTDEAIATYLKKLKPRGLLVVHISNRYADLARVFRGWKQASGQPVAIDQFVPTDEEAADGVLPTTAVAIGRTPAALAPLAAAQQWRWLSDAGPSVHWTDDHTNLLGVLTW